ncbi:restriction endonuclease subunit S [Proteus hauseri]|uniref:restriction endonuclease subunit S n=1 Tax=Proteus hauseri TaxID=183417 RepID=UPI0010097879|nr:restriction endonuclease subunit S [Proteus hauseri]QAV22139.1 restriction endonuclease [Proteus hauseri]
MGSEWVITCIDDIKSPEKYSCVGGPFGSSLSRKHYEDSGIPVIRGVNLSGDIFSETDFVFVSEIKSKELQRNMAFRGDLVFTQRGTLGQVALIPDNSKYERYIVSQSQMKLTVNSQKADSYFIYSYFRTNEAKIRIENSAIVGGVPHINLGILKEFKLRLPPLSEQKRISELSKIIDNKITLNRQINQTLEQMAQTLFKSWFVDFDPVIDNALDAGFFEQDLAFSEELLHRVEMRKSVRESDNFKLLPEDIRQLFPHTFEECAEPALGLGGWVPKGWKISKLSDFGNIICGKTPSKKENSFYGNDVPFIKIPDMHDNVFITRTFDNLSFEGSKSQIKKLIPEDSICVSSIATVGLVSITTESAHTNQQINSVVPQYKYFRDYLYFSLLNKNKHFHDLASGGSTTLNMNTTLFSNVLFIQPDKFILEFFQQESGRLLERIKCSKYEIGELTQLRDTLLPKLISGELSLSELKTAIPEETLI